MSELGPEPEWKTPIRVEAREGFTIWVEFDDGVSGLVDLSDLADQPYFRRWQSREYFERIQIAPYGDLVWVEYETQMSADEVYSRLTGISVDDLYPEWDPEWSLRSSGPSPTDVVAVEPREGYSIWVEFADGTSGIADLSFLASGPAFAGWQDREYFESVRLAGSSDVIWGDDLERCGYALYIDVTGLPWQEVMKLYERSPSPV